MDDVLVKKQKRILRLTGITIGVYLMFRYVLPVVIPFLAAAALAYALRRPYLWIRRRLRLPEGAAAALVTLVFTAVLSLLCALAAREILNQAARLAENLPLYLENLSEWMQSLCEKGERWLKLKDGEIFDWLCMQWNRGLEQIGGSLMSRVVDNSVSLVRWTVETGTVAVVIFLAAILFLTSQERIGRAVRNSPFGEELLCFKDKFVHAGCAYLKTQLVIMALTAAVCCAGLTLLGNPYSFLNGILIGLLDALPIFGTGTVFIPWIIYELFCRNAARAAGLALIYGVCYFLREIMETKVMGNSIGLGSLETLIAIYVGLKLFGIAGVILGPFGLIAIRELGGWV